MDWGLGNPNKTAALIAMLMVAVWPLAVFRRAGFWVALTIFTVLGACLIHTMSRGGILAVAVGLAPITARFFSILPRSRKLAVGITVVLFGGFAAFLNVDRRLVQGVTEEDPSIANRLAIWKAAPRMMIDAPDGWGLGQAGDAYMQWYQPADRLEGYRTLVNSHLTWLVELGWPMRFLYLAAWISVFVVCWSPRPDLLFSTALGVWAAFASAAFFSSVGEEWILWIVPLMSLAAVIFWRLYAHLCPLWRAWVLPPLGGLVGCVGLFVWGTSAPTEQKIRKQSGAVILGRGVSQQWIVADERVMGRTYGRTWRKLLPGAEGEGVAFATSVSAVPSDAEVVALSSVRGESEREIIGTGFPRLKRLLLLNPAFTPPSAWRESAGPDIYVISGAFAPRDATENWLDIAGVQFLEAPGAADYLANWPLLVREIMVPPGDRGRE